MATNDWWTVKRYLAETYRLGRYGLNDANQSDATTVSDDSRFGGPGRQDGFDHGCEINIHQNTTAAQDGSDLYDITAIAGKPSFGAGLFSLDPTPDVGSYETPNTSNNYTEFVAYHPGIRVHEIDDIANAVLVEDWMWHKLWRPFTSVVDGDMRGSDGTDYTGVNATNPPTKTAATFPFGERVLVVTDDGSGGGYARPDTNIYVEELKPYYLEVTGLGVDSADSGTLQLIDVTNSNASITLDETVIDRMEPEILRNVVQMPSGCKEVQIRLVSDGVSDVVHWANLIFRKDEQQEFVLEDSPVHILDIGRVKATPYGDWSRRVFSQMRDVSRDATELTSGIWEVQLHESVAGHAVFYESFERPAAITADSDNIYVPKEHLAALVAERLLLPMQRTYPDEYADAARRAALVKRMYATRKSYVSTQRVQFQAPV